MIKLEQERMWDGSIIQRSSFLPTELVCEHKTMKMSCSGGKVIKVLDASYGRHDPTTCGGAVHTTNCHATTSGAVVRAK